MHITLIAAIAANNAIGRAGELPWHLPDDFAFFKRITIGHPMIMGRKTMDALGRPLPGRLHLVVTRSLEMKDTEQVKYFNSVESALNWLQQKEHNKVFIIGGGEIFHTTIEIADELLLTHVAMTAPDADAFFPEIDHSHWKADWEEHHPADEKHAYPFTFRSYKRVAL